MTPEHSTFWGMRTKIYRYVRRVPIWQFPTDTSSRAYPCWWIEGEHNALYLLLLKNVAESSAYSNVVPLISSLFET